MHRGTRRDGVQMAWTLAFSPPQVWVRFFRPPCPVFELFDERPNRGEKEKSRIIARPARQNHATESHSPSTAYSPAQERKNGASFSPMQTLIFGIRLATPLFSCQ